MGNQKNKGKRRATGFGRSDSQKSKAARTKRDSLGKFVFERDVDKDVFERDVDKEGEVSFLHHDSWYDHAGDLSDEDDEDNDNNIESEQDEMVPRMKLVERIVNGKPQRVLVHVDIFGEITTSTNVTTKRKRGKGTVNSLTGFVKDRPTLHKRACEVKRVQAHQQATRLKIDKQAAAKYSSSLFKYFEPIVVDVVDDSCCFDRMCITDMADGVHMQPLVLDGRSMEPTGERDYGDETDALSDDTEYYSDEEEVSLLFIVFTTHVQHRCLHSLLSLLMLVHSRQFLFFLVIVVGYIY